MPRLAEQCTCHPLALKSAAIRACLDRNCSHFSSVALSSRPHGRQGGHGLAGGWRWGEQSLPARCRNARRLTGLATAARRPTPDSPRPAAARTDSTVPTKRVRPGHTAALVGRNQSVGSRSGLRNTLPAWPPVSTKRLDGWIGSTCAQSRSSRDSRCGGTASNQPEPRPPRRRP